MQATRIWWGAPLALALAACGGGSASSSSATSGGATSSGPASTGASTGSSSSSGGGGNCTAAAGATISSDDGVAAGKCACLAWESDAWLVSFDAAGTLGKDGLSTSWLVSCQTNSTTATGFMGAPAHQVTYTISGGAQPHLSGSGDNAPVAGCNAATAALAAASSTKVVPDAYGRFAAMAGFDAASAKLADGAKSDCGTVNGKLDVIQTWVVTAQWNTAAGIKVAGATYGADATFQKSYGPCDATDVACLTK